MRAPSSAGYTILEVMIFLAITGVLFASAVAAVNGNQADVQYSQAVRDFEQQMKDIINDVSHGYYPDYAEGSCEAEADGPDFVAADADATNQGANEECINIGKTIMFRLSGRDEDFGVATIVGVNPSITADELSLSLDALRPTLAYDQTDGIDLTTYKPIRFGAEVTKIGQEGTDETFSSLSFISNFTAGSASLETRSNGTLSTDVYGDLGDIDDNDNIGGYIGDVEAMATTPTNYVKNPPQGFYICLKTTDNRLARVMIGVDGVATATKTEFDLAAGGVCPS